MGEYYPICYGVVHDGSTFYYPYLKVGQPRTNIFLNEKIHKINISRIFCCEQIFVLKNAKNIG